MKNRRLLITFIIIIAILLFIQVIPINRSNPPVLGEIQAPAEIYHLLQKSCFDCHSHQTNWPWYSRIAPVSWSVVHDVKEGRDHLNFSAWNKYNSREKIKIYEEIKEVLEKDEMPPAPYLWMHPAAKLTQEELNRLFQWLNLSSGDTY